MVVSVISWQNRVLYIPTHLVHTVCFRWGQFVLEVCRWVLPALISLAPFLYGHIQVSIEAGFSSVRLRFCPSDVFTRQPMQALVSPGNWKGKKGKHLRRVLAEAHDAAIILINPTDPDKFLRVSALMSLVLLCLKRGNKCSEL